MVFCCFSHIGLTARQEPEWRADFPRLHATSPKMNGGKMADRLKFALLSLLVALVTFVAAPIAKADAWDKETIVTFSSPVEVPGQVLPPGTYVFKRAHSEWDRDIVQIFTKDQRNLLATASSIPTSSTMFSITWWASSAEESRPRTAEVFRIPELRPESNYTARRRPTSWPAPPDRLPLPRPRQSSSSAAWTYCCPCSRRRNKSPPSSNSTNSSTRSFTALRWILVASNPAFCWLTAMNSIWPPYTAAPNRTRVNAGRSQRACPPRSLPPGSL